MVSILYPCSSDSGYDGMFSPGTQDSLKEMTTKLLSLIRIVRIWGGSVPSFRLVVCVQLRSKCWNHRSKVLELVIH